MKCKINDSHELIGDKARIKGGNTSKRNKKEKMVI